jgi:hypothetical protein
VSLHFQPKASFSLNSSISILTEGIENKATGRHIPTCSWRVTVSDILQNITWVY